jgi:hypothetical protein
MKKSKTIIVLCFMLALATPVFAQTQDDCDNNTTIELSDGSEFSVEFIGVDTAGTTWTYRICEVIGKDLSHTDIIGIEACIDHIISTNPESVEIGYDNSIKEATIIGVKWEVTDGFDCGEFSITLDDTYETKSVEVLVKAGTFWGTGSVCGPNCDRMTFAQEIIFGVKPGFKKIKIEWKAISETDVLGYNILRAEGSNGTYQQINDSIIPAKGSPETTVAYNFKDNSVKNGTEYSYKLIEVQNNTETREHGPVFTTPKIKYFIHELLQK